MENALAGRINHTVEAGEKVVVALSGGVDSSVVAWQLRERGYNVEAIFMKNWEEDDRHGECAAAVDLADAESVCRKLDIDLRAVNFATEYWDNVFEQFVAEYKRGRTPNPDVLCNREIKFNTLLDFALQGDADRLATGHYARLQTTGTGVRLLKAADSAKDQTYFLHTLSQSQFSQALFPLGDLTKTQVRGLAQRAGLPTSDKKDSTGICFIGERPFKAFLSEYVPLEPGPIVTAENERVGEHDGLAFYTPGQRQGLGIGGRKGSNGEPWYVVGKRAETNTLVVAQGRHHPSLYARRVSLSKLSWISGVTPHLPLACAAKIRYRQVEQSCLLSATSDGSFIVDFESPQWAPAPGQSVVFYDEDCCLGGGIIESVPGAPE